MIGYGIGKIILNCRLYEFTNKKLQEREIPIPNKKKHIILSCLEV